MQSQREAQERQEREERRAKGRATAQVWGWGLAGLAFFVFLAWTVGERMAFGWGWGAFTILVVQEMTKREEDNSERVFWRVIVS